MAHFKRIDSMGGSSSLVVMKGTHVLRFKSQYHLLEGHFFTLIFVKFVMFF